RKEGKREREKWNREAIGQTFWSSSFLSSPCFVRVHPWPGREKRGGNIMRLQTLTSVILALFLGPPFVCAGPSQVGGRVSPDGSEAIAIDLPGSQHLHNLGGRDGSGCCV